MAITDADILTDWTTELETTAPGVRMGDDGDATDSTDGDDGDSDGTDGGDADGTDGGDTDGGD